jgi:hypothetical protein
MADGPYIDVVAVLGRRAGVFARAARGSTLPLGFPALDVIVDDTNPGEPSVWVRGEVLTTFQVDGIVVGRVAGNMTDVDEIRRFPAGAVIDATKFAVMEALSRALGREIESQVIAAGDLG